MTTILFVAIACVLGAVLFDPKDWGEQAVEGKPPRKFLGGLVLLGNTR